MKHKTSTTKRKYKVVYKGWNIIIPKGSAISNLTARGCDDSYRFWIGWESIIEKLTGHKGSLVAHDLRHYGLNIPAEYCNPYN